MRRQSIAFFVCVFLLISCRSADDKIAKNIQERAAADPGIDATELKVVVNGGKVTLNGHTKTAAARTRIEEIAKTEPGVWSVDDHIISEAGDSVSAISTNTSEPVSRIIVIPAGTILRVRTAQTLGSKTSQLGAVFSGALVKPVSVRGAPVLPSGASVMGSVKEVKKGGLLRGKAVLGLGLDSIKVTGHVYNIQAELINSSGKDTQKSRNIDLPAKSTVSFKLVQPLKIAVVVQQ